MDVLFVGRLVHRKGVHVLIAALRDAPELVAVVVGDGPMRDQLERASEGLRVHFAGELERADVDSWMRASGCLVVPSWDEPWGLIVQEALQCSLPVVISDDVASARVNRPGIGDCSFP